MKKIPACLFAIRLSLVLHLRDSALQPGTANGGAHLFRRVDLTRLAVPTILSPMTSRPPPKPGDDFYQYANGDWLKRNLVPVGQSSFDNRAFMAERASQQVRALIQNAASAQANKGSVLQKVGDYYASFLDQSSIDAKGLSPLADEMAKIAAIADTKSLSAYLGTTLSSEVEGLTVNADHVFGVWINQGFEDSEHNLPHIWQGGLGLPDRDDYLDSSPRKAELRNQYQAHIKALLTLAREAGAENKAARILSLETRIAQAFAPDADATDVFKQDNPWKRADFDTKAPGIDWNAYFQSAGLANQQNFIVWQPSAVIGISALVRNENIDVWKDYLRFHLLEHYAGVLPKAIAAEHFAFYGMILSGAQQMPDRSRGCYRRDERCSWSGCRPALRSGLLSTDGKSKSAGDGQRSDHCLPRTHFKPHLDVGTNEAKGLGEADRP